MENIEKIKNALKNNNNNIFNLLNIKIKKLINIKKILFGVLYELSNKENYNKYENFMSYFIEKVKEEIINLLKILINYLEEDLSLSSALFSKLSKEQINSIFNFKLSKFEQNKDYNGIKYIYFGFNLPGLFKYYIKLSNIIEEKYLIKNDNKKYDFKEEILSIDDFKEIFNNGDKKQLIYLYKDYLLYYISIRIEINTSKFRDEIINFLDILLKIYNFKNNELTKDNNFNKYYIEYLIDIDVKNLLINFSEMILFLEINKVFIKNILLLFINFIEIIPDFNNKFMQIAKNTKRNYYPDKEINEYFLFKIFESFLDVINDNCTFSYYFNDNKEKYISKLNENIHIMKSINEKIYSLSLRNIEIFIEILKINNIQIIDYVIKILQEERSSIINNNNKSVQNESLLILEKIKNEKNINYNLISNLMIKQLQKNKNNKEHIIKIFNIFLSNNKFLKFSLPFCECILFQIIKRDQLLCSKSFDKFLNFNDDMKYITETIDDKLKNSEKNNILIEIILYYLEVYYENYYFGKIRENNLNNENYEEILLGGDSLELLDDAWKYFRNNSENNNLQLLIRIAYIKQYLINYSNIIYKAKNSGEYQIFNKIKEKLNLGRDLTKDKQNLYLFILKVLYEICKDLETLKKFINGYNLGYLQNYLDTGNMYPFIDIITEKKPLKNFMLFSEFSSEKLLKEKFNNEITDKENYPLLNIILNNKDDLEFLQKIPSINAFSNIMLDYMNYKKTKQEIDKLQIKDIKEEIKNCFIITDDKFNDMINQFIKSYNILIKNKDNLLDENNYDNYNLKYFIINNDENPLYSIYKIFIEKQNNFILAISKSNLYENIIKNIQEINVQDASKENIPHLCPRDKLIEIIINNTYKEYTVDQNNNIEYNENYKKVIYNFDEIEKSLGNIILYGIKKFIQLDIGIRKIIYKDQEYDDINNDIIYSFQKKYKKKELLDKEKQNIDDFCKNKNKNECYSFLISLQFLMVKILSYFTELKEDDELNDIILDKIQKMENLTNNEKEYISIIKTFLEIEVNGNVDNNENYFDDDNSNENKEINYTLDNILPIYEKVKELYENKN